MFTGIIEEIGIIRAINKGVSSVGLSIRCAKIIDDLKLGDSVAVDGVCLTVTDLGSNWFTAYVMPETVRKTTLNQLKIGDKVNLERAVRVSDRLGGHIVTGHIDGIAAIIEKRNEDISTVFKFKTSSDILKYIVKKGSVALNGTSLTVLDVDDKYFSVSLIPTTKEITVLGSKKIGDQVNVECDIIGKYIEKFLVYGDGGRAVKKDISMDFLYKNGYI